MSNAVIGIIWVFAFVTLEAVQFVFFGGLFQEVNSFVFGACVLGVSTVVFLGAAAWRLPDQMLRALRQPVLLLKVNALAALSWLAYLGSVEMIEPAVAYTIGTGVMPVTAYLLYRFGWPAGEPMRNRTEAVGNTIVVLAILLLAAITLAGWSGFVRDVRGAAVLGVVLAVADGVFFTLLLVHCLRLDRSGVGPSAVFGLRFPLYILTAGSLAAASSDGSDIPAFGQLAWLVVIGIALFIPPLYALQRAVALISTLTLSAITAAGPFLIFVF